MLHLLRRNIFYKTMHIILNGERHEIENIITVQALLDKLGINGRLAVEINQKIIPRSVFHSHKLNSGDRVEIVHAIGGG